MCIRDRAITVQKTSAEWIKLMNDTGVPCGPILNIDETFSEPQVQHLGIAREMKHDELGLVRVVGQAVNLSRQPQPKQMRRPTPRKGAHTEDVLRKLGMSADCLLYTSPSPRDLSTSRMPSSA